MIIKKRSELKQELDVQEEPVAKTQVKEEKINLFDLDNIDFTQRQERRRGDRRRGYRRIDDRNLVSRAQEEAGTIKENSAKEGYQAGIEQAQQDIQKFKESLGSFLTAQNEVFEYIAPDILEISVDIARKIVKKEIEQDPTIILESILDVLKTISKNETRINILVNPSQLILARENIPNMITLIGLDAKINVREDDAVGVGSCILQTSNGIVDATVDTQLEIIKEAFKGM